MAALFPQLERPGSSIGTGSSTGSAAFPWDDFWKSVIAGASGSQKRQGMQMPSLIPQQNQPGTYNQNVPLYNINTAMQEPDKPNDQGMNEIIKLLGMAFGVSA